jgi:RimJ/RimL family protein N-acetyltransferase
MDGTLALLDAALAGRGALERLLGMSVAENWEGFPEALPVIRASYETTPEGQRWGSLFFIQPDVRTLVGFGGFKGSPSAEGVVEIGYAVAPSFWGQGLATDAVRQMVERAFADASLVAVDAHTLGHDNPSTRVLARSGFSKIGELNDPDDGPVWHWRKTRVAHEIIELERAALARWLDGDPSGFLEISDDEVVYFDPFVPRRIDGLAALRTYYEALRGKIHAERFELLNPLVQHTGELAVLTFNFVSYGGNENALRWNCTEVYRRRATGWKIVQTHWSFTHVPKT